MSLARSDSRGLFKKAQVLTMQATNARRCAHLWEDHKSWDTANRWFEEVKYLAEQLAEVRRRLSTTVDECVPADTVEEVQRRATSSVRSSRCGVRRGPGRLLNRPNTICAKDGDW